jgi:hypothetical protein
MGFIQECGVKCVNGGSQWNVQRRYYDYQQQQRRYYYDIEQR